jgi:hypothetical protein
MAYENNCPLKEGFLATPNINAPKTTPIPIPAPIQPVVASPVPIILAACIILLKNVIYLSSERSRFILKIYIIFINNL